MENKFSFEGSYDLRQVTLFFLSVVSILCYQYNSLILLKFSRPHVANFLAASICRDGSKISFRIKSSIGTAQQAFQKKLDLGAYQRR